ncbi:MAG: tRNA preQ1(34) S-adenosylmethionine ribosyltransferase-isomerase QueA [Peptococcaceae bacterium]|nr:tRNA preQ1(34) S-adenosylmethionine ribosyltransferase-isomerase QueA [Peptococcaceae bacterium]
MELKDFDYELPKELIAQTPIEPRDASRMLFLPKTQGEAQHSEFLHLPDFLAPGDLLVFNKTRVIPARLLGQKETTGGQVEVFLLHQQEPDLWSCLVRPGRRLMPGTRLTFGGGLLKAEIVKRGPEGTRLVKFFWEGVFQEVLAKIGQVPLPPYIHEKLKDPERYQTVYGYAPGSVAAPTAGLHFTPRVLQALADKGVESAEVILHVGMGTFKPVETERIEDHPMHSEYYQVTGENREKINRARAEGRRIIAVGTTSLRTLEAVGQGGMMKEGSGWTDIFIYPGYRFQMADGLLTNFHLPKSTLLMLVSALAGRERVLKAYEEAVRQRYRFFSFGDCMLIL